MSKVTRFDLEDQIMQCWNVTSDIETAYTYILDAPDFDLDKAANILIGIQALYEVKFNKLQETMEKLIASGNID